MGQTGEPCQVDYYQPLVAGNSTFELCRTADHDGYSGEYLDVTHGEDALLRFILIFITRAKYGARYLDQRVFETGMDPQPTTICA